MIMEALVYSDSFQLLAIVDSYESFIWTERYNEYGDFELYLGANDPSIQYLQIGYYLVKRDTTRAMVIESIEYEFDAESGSHVTITGRSLESVLDRRIVWSQTVINDTIQNGIKTLLNDAIISPTNTDRQISNFTFSESTDTSIASLTVDTQYTGENLYDVISELCKTNNIGFKIIFDDNFNFVFSLYNGVNRSYQQTENSYVIFSSTFDNLISSDYIESNSTYKNVALVGGEGEGSAQKFASSGSGTGLTRRETYVDASSISSSTDSGTISTDEYTKLLVEKGDAALEEAKYTKTFDGEMDTKEVFVYHQDFEIGDIVEILDMYGHEATSRITEMIQSMSSSGYTTYPTFDTPEVVTEESTS